MSKLTAAQQAIVSAFDNYKTGSIAVVRAFETALTDFWGKDSCNPQNLSFFLTVAKRYPQLQTTAMKLIKGYGEGTELGYFTMKRDADGGVTLTNKSDITKEMKARARLNVKAFVAAEYTSLSAAIKKGEKPSGENAYDMEAGAKAIKAALERQLKAAFEANPDLDAAFLQTMAEGVIAKVLAKDNVTAIRAKARKAA